MLAYVFWHWPRPGTAPAAYEAAQRAFHAALAAAPPPGFRRSHSSAIHGAPWAASGGAAYEDWYVVDDAAALDPLNHGAITASRQAPHDAAAALAAGGTAGLYTLRAGTALRAPRHASWFAKPAGTSYARVDTALQHIVARGASLWMRYLVLGPTPEFCLWSQTPVELPPEFSGWSADLRTMWGGNGG